MKPKKKELVGSISHSDEYLIVSTQILTFLLTSFFLSQAKEISSEYLGYPGWFVGHDQVKRLYNKVVDQNDRCQNLIIRRILILSKNLKKRYVLAQISLSIHNLHS